MKLYALATIVSGAGRCSLIGYHKDGRGKYHKRGVEHAAGSIVELPDEEATALIESGAARAPTDDELLIAAAVSPRERE